VTSSLFRAVDGNPMALNVSDRGERKIELSWVELRELDLHEVELRECRLAAPRAASGGEARAGEPQIEIFGSPKNSGISAVS
jgi:hypothetical protein